MTFPKGSSYNYTRRYMVRSIESTFDTVSRFAVAFVARGVEFFHIRERAHSEGNVICNLNF